jgi:hypothetical protein
MVELTLSTLLSTVAVNFCKHREDGKEILQSVLLAYSAANDQYGGEKVRKLISKSNNIEVQAIAQVVAKCPNKL